MEKNNSEKEYIYDYFWFDIAQIWKKSRKGYKFMQALEHNQEINVYSRPSIQIIVNY